MYILVAGLNYRGAPVQIREKYAVCGSYLEQSYLFLQGKTNINGSVILTTCNRTEIYATTRNVKLGLEDLKSFFLNAAFLPGLDIEPYIYQLSCNDAMLHLFRVISGLDSMIVGEGQILTQVKEAYRDALYYKSVDSVLNTLFHKAMYVGKKIRSETNIDRHPTSVSHAAVDFAVRKLGALKNTKIVVMGAGEMSAVTLRCLFQHGAKAVIVSNRSYDRAVQLADEFGARAIGFDLLPCELELADLVICCTGANHHVMTYPAYQAVLTQRQKENIVIIDIAVPRNIDPEIGTIPGVYLYDIDHLQHTVDDNYHEREKAAALAEQIIQTELLKFTRWLNGMHVIPVIASLKARGEAIEKKELKKALNKLGKISEREQNIISSMAHSIINQLLHAPIINLKEMAASQQENFHAEMVKNLFGLSLSAGENERNDQAEIGRQR